VTDREPRDRREPREGARDAARRAAEQRDRAVYIISVAAELAGVHPQTLRAYERLGLLSPQRTSGNTRRYSERDIERLRLIQDLTQGEGVNLAGVQMIMAMREQLDEIQRRAEDLERRLSALLDGSTSADIVPLRSVISFTWEDG
jgi:MerR family transcriptional regulator/heat shock protein HspR